MAMRADSADGQGMGTGSSPATDTGILPEDGDEVCAILKK
jgi:hypothetical protein